MRLISSFSICSIYEQNLLKAKLESESEYIDTWIITDNCYSLQRKKKQYAISDAWLSSEVPTLVDRIIYNRISSRFLFTSGTETYHQRLKPFHGEGTYFFAEQLQRLSGITKYIESEHFELDTYVFVSDVDEILVIKTSLDYKLLIELLETQKPPSISLTRHKFLYDYDNLTNMKRSVPLVSLRKSLGNLFLNIAQARFLNHPILENSAVYSIELHNCMSIDGLINKYQTYPHPKAIGREHIRTCLKLNIPIEDLNLSVEMIDNSPHLVNGREMELLPAYIRSELRNLKLNTVSLNYKDQRMRYGINT